jgi:hypothetical protein
MDNMSDLELYLRAYIKRALNNHKKRKLRDWLVQDLSFPFYTAEMFRTHTGAETIDDLQFVCLNDLQQQLFPRPLVNNYFLSQREYDLLVKIITEIRRQTGYKSLEMDEEERQKTLWGELAEKQVAYRQGLETEFGTLRDWLIHQGFAANRAEQLTSFLRMHKLEDLQHGNKEMLDQYNKAAGTATGHPWRLEDWEYNTMLSNFDLERSYYQSQRAAAEYRHPKERLKVKREKRAREQQESLAASDAHSGGSGAAGDTSTVVVDSLSSANPYFV